jgi:hypothetical protein
MSSDRCNHGKLYEEDCHKCEILWQEQTIAWMLVALEKAKTARDKARAALKEEQSE